MLTGWWHSQGFIHRDVKPDNIVQVGDVYKLIDFGLSRKMGGGKMTGYMITRWFRPPELLKLKDTEEDHKYDGRSDMWSLATTAAYLQSGQPIFYGDVDEILTMYNNYEARGILKYLICDYRDRWTAKQMFENNNIEIIDGSLSEVRQRKGKVEHFVRHLIDGKVEIADEYSHENIYLDL